MEGLVFSKLSDLRKQNPKDMTSKLSNKIFVGLFVIAILLMLLLTKL